MERYISYIILFWLLCVVLMHFTDPYYIHSEREKSKSFVWTEWFINEVVWFPITIMLYLSMLVASFVILIFGLLFDRK